MANHLPLRPQDRRSLPLPSVQPEAADVWLPDAETPFFQNYWRILKKRRGVFFSIFIVIFAGALTLFLLTPVTYTSGTLLLIAAPTSSKIADISPLFAPFTDTYYETQYGILKSRSLAERVLEEERLSSDETSAPLGPRALVKAFVAQLIPRDAASPAEIQSRRVAAYLNALSISPTRDTHLVRIEFTSPDPERSARVANAHARAYIEHGIAMRVRATEEAQARLQETLAKLKLRLDESQQALNDYRRRHDIISLDDKSNLIIVRLADLNARLTAAEAERVNLEAQVKAIRQRGASSAPAVLASRTVGSLKNDLARLEAQRDVLAARYVPGHREVTDLDSQIAAARQRLEAEARRVVAGIESAYLAIQEEERSLRGAVELQKLEARDLGEIALEYGSLLTDVETNRQLFESARAQIKETDVARDLPAANVFILDEALPPIGSDGLGTPQTVAMSLLLALIGSVAGALISELLDSKVRSTDELNQLVRLPNLGTVPDFHEGDTAWPLHAARLRASVRQPRAQESSAVVPTALVEDPAIAEVYRNIRTNIMLSRAEEPPRTILFTSAEESEGKTLTTLNLAVSFAQLGDPVLVIEADLRRPAACRTLGIEEGPGLTEALTGGTLKSQLVRTSGGFHLLSAGKRPPNPTELLGSRRMQALLEEAQDHFGYILIDGPPLIPVSDAVVLVLLVDGVVLVANQKKAPRLSLKRARDRLEYARATVLGTILNRADAATESYGYWEPPPS